MVTIHRRMNATYLNDCIYKYTPNYGICYNKNPDCFESMHCQTLMNIVSTSHTDTVHMPYFATSQANVIQCRLSNDSPRVCENA